MHVHAGCSKTAGPRAAQLAARRLLAALIITGSVALVEAVGGLVAGSLALVADAGHMLLDGLALLLGLGTLRLAARAPSPRLPFGLRGLDVLTAQINGLLLAIMAGAIAFEALERSGATRDIDASLMLMTAIFGLLANGACLWLLGGHGHNLAVKGAFLHVVGDAANSISVVVSALVTLSTGDSRFDLVASLFIATIVFGTSVPLFVAAARIILHASVDVAGDAACRQKLAQLPGVSAVIELRALRLGSQGAVVLATLQLQPGADGTGLPALARAAIAEQDPCAAAHIELQAA